MTQTTSIDTLTWPAGFDARTQARVGAFVAQLDDQLARLAEEVAALSPQQLGWQLAPGFNTIGALVAHLAIAEAWWLEVVWTGLPVAEAAARIRDVTGLHPRDDGVPRPDDAGPPEALAGRDAAGLLGALRRARAATRERLRTVGDERLAEIVAFERRGGRREHSREWILYHVLEHFAAHLGQIGLLRHAERAARGREDS